ncbi:ribosome silencing factor [Chondromyces crocatus]|uniref:Ribosomal silencing factor RsfS n=1 Tax=Chondromyces crocatus TaxID=52 RepID=A0A0K1EHM7_CHOCO|nr:ribosome silencing factor [Chondromyces crocatus]AKT40365.1 uncharacterized protein CMC5_045180 [Chondromyces crocatus]
MATTKKRTGAAAGKPERTTKKAGPSAGPTRTGPKAGSSRSGTGAGSKAGSSRTGSGARTGTKSATRTGTRSTTGSKTGTTRTERPKAAPARAGATKAGRTTTTGAKGTSPAKGAAKRPSASKASTPRLKSSHAGRTRSEESPRASAAERRPASGRSTSASRAPARRGAAEERAETPPVRIRRSAEKPLSPSEQIPLANFENEGGPPAPQPERAASLEGAVSAPDFSAPPPSRGKSGRTPLAAPKRAGKRVSAAPPAAQASSEARELALALAAAGLDKKAIGVEILEVAGRVDYADFLVIMTGRSDRHVHAIAVGLEAALRETKQMAPLSMEGLTAATWVLIDFGDVVVHVFQEDTRRVYDIEGLWMDASRVPVPGGDAEGSAHRPF